MSPCASVRSPIRRLGLLPCLLLPVACASPATTEATPQAGNVVLLVPNLDDDDEDGIADALTSIVDGDADLEDLFALPAADPIDTVTLDGPARDHFRVLRRETSGATRWFVEATRLHDADSEATVVAAHRDGSVRRTRVGVRPFVIASALDEPHKMFVVQNDGTKPFVAELRAALAISDVGLHVFERIPGGDRWAQDAVEFGHFLGSTTTAALRGMRGAFEFYPCAQLDQNFAAWCLANECGVVVAGEPRKARHFQDWYGNLEATPPFRDAAGRTWPHGRIVVGRAGTQSMHPAVLEMFAQQGVQWPPIELDTGMTQIGHVDELVNFVPSARAKHGFLMLVASPQRGVEWLEQQRQADRGSAVLLAGKRGETTIDALLQNHEVMAANAEIGAQMLVNRQLLQRELDVPDADIVDVPLIYRQRGVGVWPNGVNGVTLGTRYLSPRLFGPTIDGIDLLEQDLLQALGAAGVACTFLDCFAGYSAMDGQVHCGTNVLRQPRR